MAHNIDSTAGIVAIVAGVIAIVAVLWGVGLTVALRRLRSAQRAVLGDGSQDLVAHAAKLQSDFEALAQYVEDYGTRLDKRMDHAELRLDDAVAHHALVRYDAYGEMSGHQSASIALLDAHRSGLVLSSIHHRDSARLYVKQIHDGQPEMELSPEESEAIKLAMTQPGGGASFVLRPAAHASGAHGPDADAPAHGPDAATE